MTTAASLMRVLARESRRLEWIASAVFAITILILANGCAPKVTAPAPIAASPRFPDFVFPDPPTGLGTPATIERHKAG